MKYKAGCSSHLSPPNVARWFGGFLGRSPAKDWRGGRLYPEGAGVQEGSLGMVHAVRRAVYSTCTGSCEEESPSMNMFLWNIEFDSGGLRGLPLVEALITRDCSRVCGCGEGAGGWTLLKFRSTPCKSDTRRWRVLFLQEVWGSPLYQRYLHLSITRVKILTCEFLSSYQSP